jgi:penicillin amidase
VTLPGIPFIAAGSNTHIAWGFTNGYVDTTDLVLIDVDSTNPNNYLTPNGSVPFEERVEEIQIKDSPPCFHKILWTQWGPIDPTPFLGKPVAVRWIAHDPDAFNFRMIDLETTATVPEALQIASNIHLPVLNFMVADAEGHIGWSFLGCIPKRLGYEPELPVSFTDGTKRWDGIRASKETPALIDPPQGRLWTANNRVLHDTSLGFDQLNGIRAYQIRKRLTSQHKLSLDDMKNLQLDDEVLFFTRWQKLLLEILDSQNSRHQELYTQVKGWDGHCTSSSQGYFWIRTFRDRVKALVLGRLLAPCFHACPDLDIGAFDFEEPIYQIVSQQPLYLSTCNSWTKELSALIDEMLLTKDINISWGETNRACIQHPLSTALPFFNQFLNMPRTPLTGDWYVPRLAGPSVGASLRMIVSPGHEEEGLFNMPCGQSGHPLSPHYRDQHAAWLEGKPTPFLPGKSIHQLMLIP